MRECFFSPFNNVNLDHHKLLLQSTWNLPCVLGQSRRCTRRDQRCFFLNISTVWLFTFVLRCFTIWTRWETTCAWSSHGGNPTCPGPASQRRRAPDGPDPSEVRGVHAAEESGPAEPSPHTPGAAATFYMFGRVFTTLSFVLLLKKKKTPTETFIGYNTWHDSRGIAGLL